MNTLIVFILIAVGATPVQAQNENYELNDSHFHLTNYIQEGTALQEFVRIMGDKVGRVALFGIPLQQQWSYRVDGDRAPTYYLNSDAPLYFYSFTDALHCDGVQVTATRAAGSIRSHDHRVQSD